MDYYLSSLGENGLVIELGNEIDEETHNKVQEVCSILDQKNEHWLIEYVPAYTNITIFYDVFKISKIDSELTPYQTVSKLIDNLLKSYSLVSTKKQRCIEIPICYGGDQGPDIEYVAEYNGLTIEEVIKIHSSGDYLVYLIGFSPGFPYIGGMSKKIATPRKDSPNLEVPPRTLGIGGSQTGLYPIKSPGGWQLIGSTPLRLFKPENEVSPSWLQAGDKVKFKPISISEYNSLLNGAL